MSLANRLQKLESHLAVPPEECPNPVYRVVRGELNGPPRSRCPNCGGSHLLRIVKRVVEARTGGSTP
jgi:hypothetical protein